MDYWLSIGWHWNHRLAGESNEKQFPLTLEGNPGSRLEGPDRRAAQPGASHVHAGLCPAGDPDL